MTSSQHRRIALGLGLMGVAAAVAGYALWPRGGPTRKRAGKPTGGVRQAAGNALAVTVRALPRDIEVGGQVVVAADVLRGKQRPGALTLTWASSVGHFADASAATTTWRAPLQPGDYTVGVLLHDDAGDVRDGITISVVLPRGGDLATSLRQALVNAGPAQTADFGAEEQRLRTLSGKRDSLEDRQRAQIAMQQLAQLLMDSHRYEEALAVYRELTATMVPMDPLWKPLREHLGTAAFYLGLEDEAIAALKDAGDYASGMSGYYLGEMLSRRGEVDGAIAAFELATNGATRYADPVLRLAMLELGRGRGDAAVAALVAHSSHLGRDRIMERLERDPVFEPLAVALEQSGRSGELMATPLPPASVQPPQVIGDGPISVREATGP